MNELVAHRGPNASGVEFYRDGKSVSEGNAWNVGLAHRRLSILDLSDSGRQPMSYRDRLHITYNGEVYNYLELRTELEGLGHYFSTGTDTEVVLAAFDEWGTECFRRFNGMWGMAIYDVLNRRVVISRDRLGIKPIYVCLDNQGLSIVSEIKQLTKAESFCCKVNKQAVVDFLASGYEDPTVSFFEGVRPVAPGTFETIDLDTLRSATESYWVPENIEQTVVSEGEATDRFREGFEASVRLRQRSDVPVGSFLSGGLDSSSIVAELLRQNPNARFKAFSAVFPGTEIDESGFVEQVLRDCNARGYSTTPCPDQFREELDRFVWAHDEPVGSTSVFASYCVANLAQKNDVTVILNGQGGDELFGGYWQSYYVHIWKLLKSFRVLGALSHIPGCLLPGGNSSLFRQAAFIMRRYVSRTRGAATVINKQYSELVGSRSVIRNYAAMGGGERRLFEMQNLFLPRLLKWDDRNTMAFSLEGRYPFLDVNLIETCLSFSENVLYKRGWTKWPLRKSFNDKLPRSIVFRKSKLGFEVPQKEWVGGLLPEYEALANEESRVFQIASRDFVRNVLGEFKQGRRQKELWQTLFRVFIVDRWMKIFSLSI